MVRFPSFLPLKNKHRKTKKNDEKKGIRQTVLSWCFGPKGRLIKPWPLIGSLTEDVNTSHQGQYSKAIFNCQLKIRLGWHWLYFLCCEVDREDMGSHSQPIRCKIKTRWVGHAHFSRDFSVLFTPIGSFWCVTLLWLAVVITLVLVLYGSQGFTGDVRLRPKLTCDALILQKGERDSWIEPVSGVICLLKYTGLVIFLFHFVETSRFPWSIIHKRRDFMFSLLTSWPLFFN